MPESAEVTVAARQLDLVARGRVLESLSVTHARTTRAQPVEAFVVFAGAVVESAERHGKWIVVSFHGVDERVGIHLRMSGQLLARRPGDVPEDRHVHAVLRLGSRSAGTLASSPMHVPSAPRGAPGSGAEPVEVWFRDPRTFGELRYLPHGPPVAPDLHDPGVTAAVVAADAVRRRVGVKAVLLDQNRTVSGIGSYLADEALHRAGITPLTPAATLSVTAWDGILGAARAVSLDAAAAGGVTLPDEGWVDLWGRPGRYAPELRVHGRASCAVCGTPTESAIVGGRSARWCPRCQT